MVASLHLHPAIDEVLLETAPDRRDPITSNDFLYDLAHHLRLLDQQASGFWRFGQMMCEEPELADRCLKTSEQDRTGELDGLNEFDGPIDDLRPHDVADRIIPRLRNPLRDILFNI